MGRIRVLVLMATAVLAPAVLTVAAPAAAQTPPPDESTTTSTVPEITIPTPPDGTTPGQSPPTTEDPGTNGDAPPESVPQNDQPVPDPTVPANNPGATPPQRGRVVQVDVQTARASALAAQAAYEAAVARRQQLEASLAALEAQVSQLEVQSRQAVENLKDAHNDLIQRAVSAYIRGPDELVDWTGPDMPAEERAALLEAVAARDQASVDRFKAAQARVSRDQAKTALDLTDTRAQLDLGRSDEATAQAVLNSAQLELAVTTAGGSVVIHGFVFPVASPHSFHEDFGDIRMPGTPQQHTHQGCDVAAAEGTELYAAERGSITQLSGGGLGGTGIWLKGESGTYYYYAHLSAYAAGLQSGMLVEAGQLVGYVGHTGDAYGPHLHFEVHPNGGPAVDPYPILLAADPQQNPKP